MRLRRGKYNATRTTVDGHQFPSQREAGRYVALRTLLRLGLISELELQPRFPLCVPSGEVIGHYVADFAYTQCGRRVIEDVKGFQTPVYRLKKKHVEAQYFIEIVEV